MVQLRMLDRGSTTPIFGQSEGSKSVAPPKLESRRDWNRDAIVANFNPDP